MTRRQETLIDLCINGEHGVALALLAISHGRLRPVKGKRMWEVCHTGKWVPDHDDELMSCINSLRRELEECVPVIESGINGNVSRITLRLCRVIGRFGSYSYLQKIIRLAKQNYSFYECKWGNLDKIKELAHLLQ